MYTEKVRRIIRILSTITALCGFGLLVWVNWKIGLAIFLISFALNLRLLLKEEEIKNINLTKLYNELLDQKE